MNKKRILQLNIITVMFSQVLGLIANYFTKQALLKQLGTEYLGLQTVFGNFGDVLAMTFPATGMVMLFSMYTALEEQNREMTVSLYRFYKKVYRLLSLIIAVVGVILLAAVVACIHGSLTLKVIVPNYLLYLAGILIYNRYLNNYYFLMADQQRYVDCIVYGLGDILFLIPEIGLLAKTENYSAFLIVIIIKNAAESLLISRVIKKEYPYLRNAAILPEQKAQKKILKNILDMVISKIGSLLLYNTDSILISALVNTAIAGCYSGYYFIYSGIEYMIAAIYETVMPHIGRLFVHNSENEQYESYRQSCMFNMAAVVICICGFYYAAKDMLILWMGEEILLTDQIFPIMCINMYINIIRFSSTAYREAKGMFASISWVILIRGVLNIILSIIFGLHAGLLGIVAATAVSDGGTVFWYEPRMLLHSFGKNMSQELQLHAVTLFALFTSLYFCKVATNPIQGVSWLNFILKVLIISAVCVIWLAVLIGLHLLLRRYFRKKTDMVTE